MNARATTATTRDAAVSPRPATTPIGVAVLAVTGCTFAGSAHAQTWDANRDFSCTANPNGPWRYGGSTQPGGPFTTFAFSGQHGGCCIGCGWGLTSDVTANPGVINIDNWQIGQPRHVTLGNSQAHFATVRWTAPSDNRYEISARFRGFWSIAQIGAQNVPGVGLIVIAGDTIEVGDFREAGGLEAAGTWPSVALRAGDTVDVLSTGARPRVDLWIDVACPSDFNGDGFLDFFDADAFVACFEGIECPPGRDADFNGDGFVDFFDLDAFVGAFEAGC